jgi:protein required for attachment to host cells
MTDSWIVVADSTRCRIFSQSGQFGPLAELTDLVSVRGKLRDQDISADRPGRTVNSHGLRHALSPHTESTDQEAIRFAKEISDHLQAACLAHRCSSLYVIAEPRFLGVLRAAFSAHVRDAVKAEIPKDLTRQDPDTIRQRLRETLFER